MTTTLDYAALDEVLYGPSGPVMERVVLTAEAVKDIAKALIHTTPGDHADGSPHLAQTGHVVAERGMATVIFDAPYAAAVERGSREYDIYPKNKKALSFVWPKAGGVVVFAKVTHPATEGQHYLAQAAELVRGAPIV